MRSARSKTVTRWPARFSCSAAASPAGPEPTTATFLPVRVDRRRRHHPALVEGAIDDRDLDGLDRHRVVVDPEHARALARRRAQAAGELREVVGGVQAVDRVPPVIAVDEVVPVRDDVAERAALVAERDAAVHAPSRLLLQLVAREGEVDLLPVAQALVDRSGRPLLALDLEEAGDLAHGVLPAGGAHQLGEGRLAAFGAGLRLGRQHPLVVLRHHPDEPRLDVDPVVEDAAGVGRGRVARRGGG